MQLYTSVGIFLYFFVFCFLHLAFYVCNKQAKKQKHNYCRKWSATMS